MSILNIERKRELQRLFVRFIGTLRSVDFWIEMRGASKNISEHFKQQYAKHLEEVEEVILKFPNKSSLSDEQYRSMLQVFPLLQLEAFGPITPVECAYVEGMLDSPDTKEALKLARDSCRCTTKALKISMEANEDCKELAESNERLLESNERLLEPARMGIINKFSRRMGAKSAHEKAETSHRKILVRANAIDPDRQESANALSGTLAEDLKISRMTPSKKVGHPDGIKIDTSICLKGYSKSTVYKVLKKNGWK